MVGSVIVIAFHVYIPQNIILSRVMKSRICLWYVCLYYNKQTHVTPNRKYFYILFPFTPPTWCKKLQFICAAIVPSHVQKAELLTKHCFMATIHYIHILADKANELSEEINRWSVYCHFVICTRLMDLHSLQEMCTRVYIRLRYAL